MKFSRLKEQGEVTNTSQFLNEEDKERMAANNVPFDILSIEKGHDEKYGNYWQLCIRVKGQEQQVRIAENVKRDTQMRELETAITRHGFIEGCVFKHRATIGGHAYLEIDEYEPTPETEMPF